MCPAKVSFGTKPEDCWPAEHHGSLPRRSLPGKQHHAGMPSPHKGETADAVPRAVTRIQQLFAPAIAVLSLVSRADQNPIGCTPHGQIRLPGSGSAATRGPG